MVVPPDDMGDPHLGVIDDNREIVGRITVGALDDQVVQLLVAEGDIPFDQVADDRRSDLWTAETDDRVRGFGAIP